jgi:hypothetical protein
MKIPEIVFPILKNVASANSLTLEFWTSENGNRIMDCFFELAAGLAIAKLDLSPLPKGYGLVAVLFQWEHECQSGGWNAFEWMPNVEKISKSYSDVGLPEEANAVSRAWFAWKNSGHDFDATNLAYNEVSHQGCRT